MIYDIHPVGCDLVLDHMALIEDHCDEVSNHRPQLAPDRLKYKALERAGALLVLGAFADGKLVGYSSNIVDTHIHYAIRHAYNTALYVHPDHRASPLGLRLMAETRKAARAWGATLVLWHAKPGSQLNTLLIRKKLKVQDIVYEEQL